jgi:CubicO group peptidase (beta-lactamase class C family)
VAKDTRLRNFITLGAVLVGLIPAAVLGLFVYMNVMKSPLHPSAQEVASVTSSAPAQPWTVAADEARVIARTEVAAQNLPGMSVAVGVGGQIVWAEGFGWTDLDSKTPVAPTTRFRIGTASTVLTSVAAGLLTDDGRLKLDDDIQTYVPDYPRKQWPVTVRQVMAHTAGIRNDGGDEGPLLGTHCERIGDAVTHFAESPLLFEPGTKYRYSSYGWILISAAIEAAAKEPFLNFMQARVFEPLGMRDTEADSSTETIRAKATPYFPKFAADPKYGPDPMRPIDYSCYAGASVFLSTPSDLVRFGMAINNNGALLQPATRQLLQTSQRLTSGTETGYGLGWDIETVTLNGSDTRWVGHDGTSLGGTVASFITFPERGLVVSVLSNTSYADVESVATQIAAVFAKHSGSTAVK